MATRMSPAVRYTVAFVALVGALIAARSLFPPADPSPAPPATQIAATMPATQPATAPAPPATKPTPPPESLLDVVRREQPDYPTTEPLDLPADLPDAARIELSSPVYLDGVGNLWITDPRGPGVDEILKKPLKSRTILTRDTVLAALWSPDLQRPDVYIKDSPGKISGGGVIGYSFANETSDGPRRQPLPSTALQLDWTRATRFGKFCVVPGDQQLMLLQPLKIRRLVPIKTSGDVLITASADTLYAWSPEENGRGGTAGGMSFDADGRQTVLSAENGFGDKIIQLIPLADGSVLLINRADNGIELKLKSAPNTAALSAEQQTLVETLARKLADPDPLVREQSQRQLESLGPLVLPQLEALRESLPPGAQVRIEALLGQRFAPTLAGLHPLEGEVKTIARFRDGGCVLQLVGGGTTADSGDTETVIPAFVAIRPGKFIQRLSLDRVANFDPAKYKLGTANDEWVVFDPVAGPQRWIGSKLSPLVDPPLADYDDLVGIDASRRWIFRSSKRPGKTLIIDPALPDITPRLPTWTIDAPDGAGWTNKNWPAVKRGERLFVLGENGWRMPDKGEHWQTKIPPSASGLGGAMATFQFGDITLIVSPGNVVTRFRKSPRAGNSSEEQSAKPEAVFTEGLPSDKPRRLWLDPASRLVFAGNALTVTFPNGRVPKAIGNMMLRGSR